MNNSYFVVHWLRLHLAVVNLCLFSAIRKQKLKQYNYRVDESELLTRCRTDFTSSILNLSRWGADSPLAKVHSGDDEGLIFNLVPRVLFSRQERETWERGWLILKLNWLLLVHFVIRYFHIPMIHLVYPHKHCFQFLLGFTILP